MSDIETQIEGIMGRLRNRTPEQIAAAEKAERENRDRRKALAVIQLQREWNAPARHVQCSPDVSGPWGETLVKTKAKLGTGCLLGLVGNRGNGKTQMAVELMKHATDQERSALFVTAIDFFMQIKATFKNDARETEEQIIKRFTKPSFLVVDEYGKRGGTDWENNLLFELVNRRYNRMGDTLLIDNRTAQEFAETIGPSLASRMNDGGGIVVCDWQSFRK